MASNGNSVSGIVNAYAQAGLAGVLAIVLSLNLYFAHQREQAEIAADQINLKAINESNSKIAEASQRMANANDRIAKAAEEEVVERRKQAEAMIRQSKLIDDLINELKKQ